MGGWVGWGWWVGGVGRSVLGPHKGVAWLPMAALFGLAPLGTNNTDPRLGHDLPSLHLFAYPIHVDVLEIHIGIMTISVHRLSFFRGNLLSMNPIFDISRLQHAFDHVSGQSDPVYICFNSMVLRFIRCLGDGVFIVSF